MTQLHRRRIICDFRQRRDKLCIQEEGEKVGW